MGSKYGARECSGTVDWGLIYFDIYKDGYSWTPKVIRGTSEVAKSVKL